MKSGNKLGGVLSLPRLEYAGLWSQTQLALAGRAINECLPKEV